ncbi:MAG: hypothetical protein ACLQAT_28855 [Candidatus Binataceae bacterium]
MTLATFYLVCLIVGATLSVLSFVSGALHLPHLHLPHAHLPTPAGQPHAAIGRDLPFVNFATVTIFLAWFGGAGYLLTEHSTLIVAAIMLLATAVGLVGSATLFWLVVKQLIRHDQELDPADYDRIGALGHIGSPIRAGGTGEIIFSLAGSRHTCGARSENGEALPRGAEVIITRYEHGIAYVRRWDEMADGQRTVRE